MDFLFAGKKYLLPQNQYHLLLGVEHTSSDYDIESVEVCGGARVKPQSGLRLLDGTMGACQGGGGGGDSQIFEEVHQCNCGHKGPIASHLRTNQECVQGFRDELSLGAEMSDESLIVQATLVLHGCPAISCPGGNHDQIPENCVSWWKKCGRILMQWEEPGENLISSVIKQKCKEFVRELTRHNVDERQKMNKTAYDDYENAADRILRKGNMEETTMFELDDVFLPPITSTQVHTRDGRQEGGKRPPANVSLPWDY